MHRQTTTITPGRTAPPVRWIGRKPPSRVQHAELTRRAVERVVAEVWEQQIWPPLRPFIAARLDRVRLTAGRDAAYRHRGRRLSLAVPSWKPTEDWDLDVRYAVGSLMAYALLLEFAALAAGADSGTGSLATYRQGACSADWFLALHEPAQGRLVDSRQRMRAMAEALAKAWGLQNPRSLLGVVILDDTGEDVAAEWDDDVEEDWEPEDTDTTVLARNWDCAAGAQRGAHSHTPAERRTAPAPPPPAGWERQVGGFTAPARPRLHPSR
jgi:hypothetical protein